MTLELFIASKSIVIGTYRIETEKIESKLWYQSRPNGHNIFLFLQRAHASATLKEARGYSASTPTTELIKSKKGSSASLAESAGPGAGTS